MNPVRFTFTVVVVVMIQPLLFPTHFMIGLFPQVSLGAILSGSLCQYGTVSATGGGIVVSSLALHGSTLSG